MKTKLLLIIIINGLFNSALMNAQCSQQVTNFGNNASTPMYNITGDVTVTLNSGGQTITLDTGANFMTAAGPDINVYLVKSNGMSNTQLATTPISNLENIHFGLIGSSDAPIVNQNGAKSFTVNIPNGENIEDYDTVFFYCFQFSAFWDLGKIAPFTIANCNILSVDDDVLNNLFTIYPNPVKNNLFIKTNLTNRATIKIYNILGEVLYEDILSNTSTINTQNFKHGIYLIEISSGGKKITKKLIKH